MDAAEWTWDYFQQRPSVQRKLAKQLAKLGLQFQIDVLFASFEVEARLDQESPDDLSAHDRDDREMDFHILRHDVLDLDPPLSLEQFGELLDRVRSDTDRSLLIGEIFERIRKSPASALPRQVRGALERIIAPGPDGHPLCALDDRSEIAEYLGVRPGWYTALTSEIGSMPAGLKTVWLEILGQVAGASASRPSARWSKTMSGLIAQLPPGDYDERFLRLTHLIVEPTPGATHRPEESPLLLSEHDVELRGLIWGAASSEKEEVVSGVGRLAREAFQKIRGAGPVSVKIGNACLYALSQMSTDFAAAELARLATQLKSPIARKTLNRDVAVAAERRQMTVDEMFETVVPTYGLTDIGRLEAPLGQFTAELVVADSGRATIAWRQASGKLQKSVPASIKADHAAELNDLKSAAREIEQTVTAQRSRLEDLFLQARSWPVAVWRERYLDHPLVGILARRLIWTFKNTGLETSGTWLGDTIVDVDDEPLDWIEADGTTVELWHPIGRPMDDVLAWRHWFERHEIRQPFKQAHREVYVLTDAELRTRTYSNRYAAHILRQHQFNALCVARGWANKLRLMVDADYSAPTKSLQNWGLRAEFWVNSVGDVFGTDTTDAGVYLHLATDQLRFYRLAADLPVAHATGGPYMTEGLDVPLNQPLPLEAIPPIVFSEIMRDVDLFVGVASVGNDPAWSDGGPGGRYLAYWQSFSFGDLTPSAQTRKQVLERLVPRLKIGPRCSFSAKFLVVRGDLRTYKIHLGSGNILMEPNDQYLCIVPDSSPTQKEHSVFLPFEGDRTLSIILSKAMLLAEDRKISDPTITRQIKAT